MKGLFGQELDTDESATTNLKREHSQEIQQIKHEHQIEINTLKADHNLELRDKEFELKHFKDEEVQKLQAEVSQKDQRIAVLEKENEMLTKITDLNSDVIDVKDLVSQLIKKLPEVNLSSLTVNVPNGSNK